jgi:tRNA nucleotidyltransferase (CCA-adding enzyme)
MITKLELSILAQIKPTLQEEKDLKTTTNKCVLKIKKELSAHPIKIIIGGSLAKDTNLTNNNEVDLFIAFKYLENKTKAANISSYLKKALDEAFGTKNITLMHGSRDYYQVHINSILFEIIPIIDIEASNKALNITDISPLHAKWINKHAQGIKDDIRLAKQFAKSARVYGAESYLSGFSGYIIEILTTYYGSFEKLITAAASWKTPVVIDPTKFYTKQEVFFKINKSKLSSPIIIVDPVDKKRNAAAALGVEKFKLFSKKAREYLKKPTKEFFELTLIKLSELEKKAKKKKCSLVYIECVPLEGKRDVVGAKLRKVFDDIKTKLQDFSLKEADWQWEEQNAKLYLLLKNKKTSLFKIRDGPPTSLKDHVTVFRKKNAEVFEKSGKLYAKVKVKYPQLEDYVNYILETAYFKERVVKVAKKRIILL